MALPSFALSCFRFRKSVSQRFACLGDPLANLNHGRLGAGKIRTQDLLQFHFGTKQLVCVLVEVARVPASNSKIAVGTFRPTCSSGGAVGDFVEIWGSADRIGNGGKENIWSCAFHVMNRFLDILHVLAFVSPHQKHSRLNSAGFADSHRVTNLFNGDATLHCIQYALGAAFGTDPDPKTSKLRKEVGHMSIQSIGARNALERNLETASLHFCSKFSEPTVMDGENVIGNPKHVRTITVQYPFELIDDRRRFSAAVRFSVNGMTAPPAIIRTATRGDQRHRAGTVMGSPGLQIPADGNGLAARPGLPVDIGYERSRRRALNSSAIVDESNSADVLQFSRRAAPKNRQQFFHCDLSFADNDHVGSRQEILLNIGSGLRTSDNRFPAGLLCRSKNAYNAWPGHEVGINAKNCRLGIVENIQ